jgi:glycosyltransferase involved in cell wall biosynthesis
MKFTIFTGFYNYVDTIDQLLNSVLSQTHQDWEWIIWDDFSENQKVSELLEKVRSVDGRIKRVYPTFKKQFFWNPPISEATGEICVVLDSDDMMLPNLLAAYAHNFRKFPGVQMISCNSEMRNGNIAGEMRSLRYINYQDNCNLLESMNDDRYEYNWGDCRAWRNRVARFTSQEWKYCGDDLIKVLTSEKLGKTLFLPRTLHVYSHRDGSVSHTPEHGKAIQEENEKIISIVGKGNDQICSVEDFYDRKFDDLTPLYLSQVNYNLGGTVINYLTSTTDLRGKEVVRELFYEHMIEFNSTKTFPHVVVKIRNRGDVEKLKECLIKYPPTETLTVEAENELREDVMEALNHCTRPWAWFLYNKFNCTAEFADRQ